METFSITCNPYYETVKFCLTENKEEARKYFNETFKIDVGEKEDNVSGYCISTNTVTAIWLPRLPQTPAEFGVLHHEIYHAVCNILERKGIKDRGEPFAYLLGFLIHVFYTKYPPIREHDFKIFGKQIWIK